MAEEKRHTKSEHFIPRVYLRGFSNNGRFVMAYNAKKDIQFTKPFSIADICQKKYLYEYRNTDNSIININEIENGLGIIEGLFSEYRERLQKKAYHDENLNTNCFFCFEEKAFWKGFITTQILRYPDILNNVKAFISTQIREELSDSSLRNVTLHSILSLDKIVDTTQRTVFSDTMDSLSNMSIHLFVDKTKSLFTTDKALTIEYNKQTLEYEHIYFPVTSDLAIILANGNHTKPLGKNCMHHFNAFQLAIFKKQIAATANEWIYSRNPISNEDIKLIREVRENS